MVPSGYCVICYLSIYVGLYRIEKIKHKFKLTTFQLLLWWYGLIIGSILMYKLGDTANFPLK